VEHPFDAVVGSEQALRALYREPSSLVRKKKVPRIDGEARRLVETSPFCLLATSDADGHCDVSPRGGPPGFVRVLDERRLAIPDLNGNNLLDSLTNIVANPHVGLLFVVPGHDETLRAEGRASLTTDPALLALWDGELRPPKVVIGVEVGTVYVHCAKSFRRGRVWDVASWSEYDAPGNCEVLGDQQGFEVTEELRALVEKSYADDLARDRPEP
jgi:PPOX class probable FMN-dependent enzyme